MANTRPARYKARRNTPKDAKRQKKRKLLQSNVANGGIQPKVRAVIDEYFRNGFHQKAAMIAAGYSETTATTHQFAIFGRADVKAEIERRMAANTAAADLDDVWLMRRLKLLAGANIGDILRKLAAHGNDLNCLSDDELYMLGDYEVKHGHDLERDPDTGEMVKLPWTKIRVKGESRHAAILTALKKLGLFKESMEVSGDADVIAALMAGRKRAAGIKE